MTLSIKLLKCPKSWHILSKGLVTVWTQIWEMHNVWHKEEYIINNILVSRYLKSLTK